MAHESWTTSLRVETGATSIVGSVRDHNEDAALALTELALVAVADGLGGHEAGERASALAVETLESRLRAAREAGRPAALEEIFDAFVEANAQILADAEANPERSGMGTTLTAAVVAGDRVLIGHIGDSRAWRIRDGQIERLTRDHTLVEDQLREGILTEEQADQHPMRHVLSRCLGMSEEIEVDLAEGDVAGDDIYVLASDGLLHGLTADDIEMIVRGNRDPEVSSQALVDSACEQNGQDNITAAVLICHDS
jgi:serine/threonine protein phosphatase PrpC